MIKNLLQEGFALKEKGHLKHAIEVFYKALELDNTSSELLLEIADVYYRMGNEEKSLNYIEQILDKTHGKGVDRIIIAGGDNDTFDQAVRMLKPGGKIGNVNYLGEGDYVKIPRTPWGCGMGHKMITGGLMPGGRLRSEKLARLVETHRIHPEKLITHRFNGLENVEPALMLMKDKPRDLIKPLVII